jgi:hypothetical protein
MAWVTWRQHRLQLMGMGALLALGTLAALVSSLSIRAAYHRHALSSCLPPTSRSGCDLIVSHFQSQFAAAGPVTRYLAVLPALAALFVGAPLLAREFEHGTHRLAWTQSITRQRWLFSKTLVLSAATLVCAAAASALTMWWRHPFDALEGRIGPPAFDVEGLVVPAYAVFALAVGILSGLLLRRTIPAMTVALAAFAAVRLGVAKLLRPHFLSPLHQTGAGIVRPPLPRDWILHDALITSTGRRVTALSQDNAIVHAQKAQLDAKVYMVGLGWRRVVTFQPDDRFWAFQAIEAGVFLALALVTVAAALWLVRRTPS